MIGQLCKIVLHCITIKLFKICHQSQPQFCLICSFVTLESIFVLSELCLTFNYFKNAFKSYEAANKTKLWLSFVENREAAKWKCASTRQRVRFATCVLRDANANEIESLRLSCVVGDTGLSVIIEPNVKITSKEI